MFCSVLPYHTALKHLTVGKSSVTDGRNCDGNNDAR